MNREKAKRIEKAMVEIQDALSDINQILPNINQILSSEDTDDSEAYNKGLEDAWEFVRKIFDLNNSSMEKVFGFREKRKVFVTLDAHEALAKLEAYEKAQEEIKVGDVVVRKYDDSRKYLVITEENDNSAFNLGVIDLKTMTIDRINNGGSTFVKTGKHIDISSILEQIKE